MQKVEGARLLHDLGAGVAAELAEAIVAEDNGFVLHLRVGYDEIPI